MSSLTIQDYIDPVPKHSISTLTEMLNDYIHLQGDLIDQKDSTLLLIGGVMSYDRQGSITLVPILRTPKKNTSVNDVLYFIDLIEDLFKKTVKSKNK